MRVLPRVEFMQLAKRQGFSDVEHVIGFVDESTFEPIVLEGQSTSTKLHELGHEEFGHVPKVLAFYGRGKKDVSGIKVPWGRTIDDEIEAEIYSFKMRGKKLTPKVGMMAVRELVDEGWDPHRAFSLVIGRLRRYGINTSWKEREEMAGIMRKAWGIEVM